MHSTARHVRYIAAIFAVATLATTARAQEIRNVGFDLTLGGGSSSGGGIFNPRGGPGVDAVLSNRVRSFRHGGLVAALSGGFQSSFDGFGDTCRINPGHSGCAPSFPALTSIEALAGWELGSTRTGSVRALAGPGYFSGGADKALGLQSRVDLATPALWHVALVGSWRRSVLPSFRDDVVRLWSIGFGLRFR
jgi:hypothetical protein